MSAGAIAATMAAAAEYKKHHHQSDHTIQGKTHLIPHQFVVRWVFPFIAHLVVQSRQVWVDFQFNARTLTHLDEKKLEKFTNRYVSATVE